jgi:hypothetical protein
MALIAATQQFWLHDLRSSPSRFKGGLRDWVLENDFHLDKSPTKRSTELFVHTSSKLIDALNNELISYSSASFESVKAVTPNRLEPKSSAWLVISNYYASYFAANALMRLFGHFCSNLDARHATTINETASLYSIPIPSVDKKRLSTGVYAGTFKSGSDPSIMIRSLENFKGGVHMQFWGGFHQFLTEIAQKIPTCTLSKDERDRALSELRAIKEGLAFDGYQSGGWLSEVRNSINYRLEHGVWHPYSNTEIDGRDLYEISQKSFSQPMYPLPNLVDAPVLLRATQLNASLVSWLFRSLEVLGNISNHQRKKHILEGPLFVAKI